VTDSGITVAITGIVTNSRLTVAVTGIVTNSRLTVAVTGIVTNSRMTVAVTGIVTNSTTGIGTVKLLSDKKCKSYFYKPESGMGDSGGVAPLLCKQLIVRTTRLVRFQRKPGIFRCHRPVVYFVSL
jgi:hypothetical protein